MPVVRILLWLVDPPAAQTQRLPLQIGDGCLGRRAGQLDRDHVILIEPKDPAFGIPQILRYAQDDQNRATIMKGWLLLAVALAVMTGAAHAETITLEVTLKLTDSDYKPLPRQSVRLAFSGQDWHSPTAGQRVVTDAKGEAHLSAVVQIDHQIQSQNVGFTPLSLPVDTDHLLIAAEMERILPLDGHDYTFHWLYTENIFRYPGGSTSGGYIDVVYSKGPDGRFNKRLDPNLNNVDMAQRTDPEQRAIGSDQGYVPTDFGLERHVDDKGHPTWTLSLGFKRMPTPVRQ